LTDFPGWSFWHVVFNSSIGWGGIEDEDEFSKGENEDELSKDENEDEFSTTIVIVIVPGAETPVSGARTVWRISRPLDATWNIFNPSRDDIKYQHWAVLVANMDKEEFEKKNRERKGRGAADCYWGEIHELHRDRSTAKYCFDTFTSKGFGKGMKVTFVGNTTLTDEEIMDTGVIPFVYVL
jgi:hypothetical protein